MNHILKTLTIFLISSSSLAQGYKIDEGFYSGLDPTKFNENTANIDRSISIKDKPVDGKYYGYKFNNGGFFLAPEAFRVVNTNNLQVKNFNDSKNNSSQDGVNYDVKANIGYEFNKGVSGFVTYDVGNFSYNSAQKSAAISQNQNSAIGVGSQINFSDDLKVKFTYTQQQMNNTAVNGGQIKTDIIRFGTSYSF